MYTTHYIHGHSSAAVRVRKYENGDMDLISYSTTVIRVRGDRIECTGTYSRTTIKHIGWFIREYFPRLSYYDMKSIAHEGFKPIASLAH